MKTVEIIGYRRANLGKSDAQKVRDDGNVPCVLYGGNEQVQFHPVSEILLHADFLRVSGDRKIKMQIPVRLVGQAPGVAKGGTLVRKRAALKIYAFPKDMPDH